MDKCLGCGFCCFKIPCEASRRLYPAATLCPALYWNGKAYRCKLMELPGDVGAGYRKELYANEGCSANLNSWRKDIKSRNNENVKTKYMNPLSLDLQIFIKCLAKEFISSDKLSLILFSFENELEKRGYDRSQSEYICNYVRACFFNNRSSFMKDFMG